MVSFYKEVGIESSGKYRIISHGKSAADATVNLAGIIYIPNAFHNLQVSSISSLWNSNRFLDIKYCMGNFEFHDESLKSWITRNGVVAKGSEIAGEFDNFLISKFLMDQITGIMDDVIQSNSWNNLQVGRCRNTCIYL